MLSLSFLRDTQTEISSSYSKVQNQDLEMQYSFGNHELFMELDGGKNRQD